MKLVFCNPKVVLLALLLPVIHSCAVFRSNIDDACVDQFRHTYPAPQDSRFVLPWNIGDNYMLTQGNCTFESHSLTANQHMAFDFKMPMGTPIVAAAAGRILFVEEQFRDHVDNGFEEANIIGIEHAGGTLTWYMHLRFEGSLVKANDAVSQGELIGYSGNTGDSAYPHLHFFAQQVIDACYDSQTKTAKLELCPHLPVSFLNASPADSVLREWIRYTALPY